MPHGLDTDNTVYFYEQEFYVLSNFSCFKLLWKGVDFLCSEVAYHWERFPEAPEVRMALLNARSAHDAYTIAQAYKHLQRLDWSDIKKDVMKELCRAKANQHLYVKKKLMETGQRLLVENSWRDGYWGSGEDGRGQNWLGHIWMDLRTEFEGQHDTSHCYI